MKTKIPSDIITVMDTADHVDIKTFESKTNLRGFVSAMLSYYPWWIIWLYRIRTLLVRLLGLEEHEAPDSAPHISPEDLSFSTGDNATFFIVNKAEEDDFWLAETPEDKHLKAFLGIVQERVSDSENRFHVITIVYYQHWTGPVYFNLIRPFHHLVVARMGRHGAQSTFRPVAQG